MFSKSQIQVMLNGVRSFRKTLPSVLEKSRLRQFTSKMCATVNDLAADSVNFLTNRSGEEAREKRRSTRTSLSRLRPIMRKFQRSIDHFISSRNSLDPQNLIITATNIATLLISYLLIFAQSIKLGFQEDLYDTVPFFKAMQIMGKSRGDWIIVNEGEGERERE